MDSVNFLEKSFPFNRDLSFYEIRSILREGLKHENVLYMLEDYCFLPYAKKKRQHYCLYPSLRVFERRD